MVKYGMNKWFARRRAVSRGTCLSGIVGLWMATALPAGAADADGKFAVKGAARTTCTHFVTAREGRKENTQLYALFGAWLEGYLSALNERSVGTYDLTSFESTELLATLIYSNCKRALDKPFFNVVRRLVSALNTTRLPAYSKLVEVTGAAVVEGAEPRDVRLHLYEVLVAPRKRV